MPTNAVSTITPTTEPDTGSSSQHTSVTRQFDIQYLSVPTDITAASSMQISDHMYKSTQ